MPSCQLFLRLLRVITALIKSIIYKLLILLPGTWLFEAFIAYGTLFSETAFGRSILHRDCFAINLHNWLQRLIIHSRCIAQPITFDSWKVWGFLMERNKAFFRLSYRFWGASIYFFQKLLCFMSLLRRCNIQMVPLTSVWVNSSIWVLMLSRAFELERIP